MESSMDLSVKIDDSNAIMLPGKKNKRKKMNKVSGKLKTKRNPEPSKSQKRKLKKLEEDKEKEILLSESIETLEKYKIGEDAYSVMWSSRNLGQVETVREKHRRVVQFSKAGLELPNNDLPIKRKASNDSNFEIESDANWEQSRQRFNDSDASHPVIEEREVTDDVSIFGNGVGCAGGSGTSCPIMETSYENNKIPVLGDPHNSLPISSYNGTEMEMSMDKINEYPKEDLKNTSNVGDGTRQQARTPSIVVHVSRPKELENKRKDLPIVMMEQEIMEAISDNISVIICGETGCGKTTQVPQFLYEAGYGSSRCSVRSGMIGVTQPRRVAVLATAKRVAYELGLRLGKEVGFQVRYDKRIGDNCSIKLMTDGILLRELQNDFLLKRYSIIILDEAHERSLNTDILIGMLSRVIQQRQKIYEEQTKHEILSGKKITPENKMYPLKLVLMSATLRVEDFVSGRRIFYEPPPVIEVPTRQYPVTIHFSKRTEIVDYIGGAYKKVLKIHKELPPGGILVFVTGQREVENLCQMLRKASRDLVLKSKREISDVPTLTEVNPVEDNDVKEIAEAFEIERNSDQQTDRFSFYDGDHGDIYEEGPHFSADSYEDSDVSDLEYFSDMDLFNQEKLDSDGNLADVFGEDGNLASLKAAFEVLAGKNTLKPDSNGKDFGLDQSKPRVFEKMREAQSVSPMYVLPLYAMLPASAQLHVFDKVKSGDRLVVVATNVAETSLTIPGIKYVVDTGREKVKIYNSSNGMENYEVEWISKASAAQRAGRAGRTGPGHCYRLYSSAVFSNTLSDFSTAEISKIPVDGVVLLMKSMGIDKVANFPFPTPPEVTAIVEAERCLKVLEAVDANGHLTPLGKAMAQFPMSPRHSRMLLTVIQILKKGKEDFSRPNLVLGYTVAAAAALSLSNPFNRQSEGNHYEKSGVDDGEKVLGKQEKARMKKEKEEAKASRAKFYNPTSDALTIAYALQCFEVSASPTEFCNDNKLVQKTMEEMSKLRKQLLKLVFHQNLCSPKQDFSWTHGTVEDVECAWRVSFAKLPLLSNEEELLGQAICAGWADRVAKRVRGHSGSSDGERKVNAVRYQACMVKEMVFLHHRSSVSRFAPEYLVYSELLHTKRPYIHGATSVKPDWLVKYAGSLCTLSAHTDSEPYYEPLSDQILCWMTPTFGPYLWQLPLHSFPIKDDKHRVAVFAFSLLGGKVLPCLGSKSIKNFLAESPAIILRPESAGKQRVGNLLFKLKTRLRTIDSCAKLRETWDDNPGELYHEIQDWFREGFHDQFEALWASMHREVRLDPNKRFAKSRNSKRL